MENNKFIAGKYKTHFHGKEYEYKSFSPSFINKPFKWQNSKISVMLEESSRLLGGLNECSLLVPDISTFIRMHVIKEATISTRIEGTRTEIDEAVLLKKDIEPEKRDDWSEVHNYMSSMNYAISKLKKLPLSIRLIKSSHKIILKGVRGQKRQPGEIRNSQNWIGGNSIKNAFFVPPHHEELPELITDLEKFLHNNNLNLPKIIKVALTHYQFETVHPFLDGNGRIGRLLISLQLVDYKILREPILYLSDYLERNKGTYYDSLTIARQTGNIEQWIVFFLEGLIDTALRGKNTFEKIIKLRMEYEDIIRTLGRRAQLGQKLLLTLFSNPVLDIKRASTILKVAYNTAGSLMKKLEEFKMLRTFKLKSGKKLFVLWKYFNLFKK